MIDIALTICFSKHFILCSVLKSSVSVTLVHDSFLDGKKNSFVSVGFIFFAMKWNNICLLHKHEDSVVVACFFK